MKVLENISLAIDSVKANFLRSLLTLLIIAVGIACLVGILTAIDTVLFSMSNNFNRLGANSFSIYPKREQIKSNRHGKRAKIARVISFKEAMDFKDKYTYGGARIAIDIYGSRSASIKYGKETTTPSIRVVGVDENYFYVTAYELADGRNFSKAEIENGNNKVILGSEIVKKLFDGKDEKAVGAIVGIGNAKYRVVGTLKQKGSSGGGGNDLRVFIPLIKAKTVYGTPNSNYSMTAAVSNSAQIEDAVSSAIGTMRNVRKLKASEENDFIIRKSDGILEILKDMTTELRLGTLVIAMMTLLGAAIGLMNIMLVSVTERTREIGVRKALGATRNNILVQFLSEAVVICQLGGLLGIILGIIVGFIVSIVIKGQFVIPWNWMILGILVCLAVGVISGLYPALKASRLDPIESLRYE